MFNLYFRRELAKPENKKIPSFPKNKFIYLFFFIKTFSSEFSSSES